MTNAPEVQLTVSVLASVVTAIANAIPGDRLLPQIVRNIDDEARDPMHDDAVNAALYELAATLARPP